MTTSIRTFGKMTGVIALAGILLGSMMVPTARAGGGSAGPINDSSDDVGAGVPAWQDVVAESITGGVSSSFTFTETVGAAIPSSPGLPKDTVEQLWWFCIQVNASFSATGWPFSGNGNPLPCQYFVFLLWDGTYFSGVFVNRSAQASGGSPTLQILPFTISSATISWTVDRALLGSPSSFGWWVATENRGTAAFEQNSSTDVSFLKGNLGFRVVDFDAGPNSGFAPWPY